MIAYKDQDVKDYFVNKLSLFAENGQYVVIIVDPYFGGRKPEQKIRVEEFLDFMKKFLNPVKIVWFYNSNKCPPMALRSIETCDLFKYSFIVHDRFLFLYDTQIQAYVKHFHLGGSLNSIDFNRQDKQFSVMRVSELYEYEFSEIDKLLQHLENIYLRF